MAGGELDAVVRGWATAFTEEVKDFAAPEVVDDSQVGEKLLYFQDCKNCHFLYWFNPHKIVHVYHCTLGGSLLVPAQQYMYVNLMQVFGEVYHSLIHSPLSMTLLQLEATYAAAVEAICR